MLFLGTKNVASQTIPSLSAINVGASYRRYTKTFNGRPTIANDGVSLVLNQKGFYHVTAVITGTLSVAGDLVISLVENGNVVLDSRTETVATATTELHTITIDYYVLVDSDFIFGVPSTGVKSISLVNASTEEAVISDVVVNIDKVV